MDSLPNSEGKEPCSESAVELFSKVLYPLDMEIIIERILLNSETSDLANCRLLSKRWNKEGVKELLRRDKYAVIHANSRTFKKCVKFARKSSYPGLLRSIHIRNWSELTEKEKQFILWHGKYLRELSISLSTTMPWWNDISEILFNLDLWAPNLTKFSMGNQIFIRHSARFIPDDDESDVEEETPKFEFPSPPTSFELRKPSKIQELILSQGPIDRDICFAEFCKTFENYFILMIKKSPFLRSIRINYNASLKFIQEVTKVEHVMKNLDKLGLVLNFCNFFQNPSPKLDHLCTVKFKNLRVVHMSRLKVYSTTFDVLMQNFSKTVKKLKLSGIEDEKKIPDRGGFVKVLEFMPNLEYFTYDDPSNRNYPSLLTDLEKYQIVHPKLKYLKLTYLHIFRHKDQYEKSKVTKLPVLRDTFPNLKHLDFLIARSRLSPIGQRPFYKQMEVLSTFCNLETLTLLLDEFSGREDIFTALSLLKGCSNLKHLTLIHVCSSDDYECKHSVSSTIKGFTKMLLELKNLKSIRIVDCNTLFKEEKSTEIIQDFAEREGVNLIQVNRPDKWKESPFQNDNWYENRFDCLNPTEVN